MRTQSREKLRQRNRTFPAMRGLDMHEYKEFIPKDIDKTTIPTGSMVRRDEWGAKPPLKSDGKLCQPILYVNTVNVFREAEGGGILPGVKGPEAVRWFQQQDMNEGMSDIRSNFIIDEDGIIYEGRGWEQKPAITNHDCPSKNMEYLEVCYIGDFSAVPFEHPIHEATGFLMAYGVVNGALSEKAAFVAPLEPYDNFTENFLKKHPMPGRKYIAATIVKGKD